MHTVAAADLRIPAIGFGTWQLDGPTARSMVETALELGYRHIDTAYIYHNEKEVGEAIAHSNIPRDEIFLTTKIWIDFFRDGDLQRAAEASVEKLNGPVDLLLLHWPKPDVPLAETIKALNAVKAAGLTRGIGVSNFPSAQLREAATLSEAPLVTNQVEYHPYLSQQAVLQTARDMGASLTAWSPIAQGKVVGDPVLIDIGKKHGKTPAQVTLRWLVQQEGVIAIPRTTSATRAAENLAVFDFALTEAEMARIFDLARPDGRLGDWLDPTFHWDKR
jgi:diketogulonate reductase-like aldo/keto reductase